MAKPLQKTLVAECPECNTNIRFHKPLRVDQIVTCPECDQQLVVYQLNPLELDWAYDDDDDDNDDDYNDNEEWE